MVLFFRELRRNRKSFLIWTLSLVLYNVLVMALYPAMAEQQKSLEELIEQMPKGLISAFGLDKLDISEILGFYASKSYILVTLFGSIYAMLLGSGILSKEEGDKTIEFLLAKPITRNKVVIDKLLCVLFYLILLNLIFSVTNYIVFEIVKKNDYDRTAFLLLSVAPFLLHAVFAMMGFFISVFVVKAKTIFPVSIGLVLGFYFLGIVSALSNEVRNLKYLSPFQYVDAADLILNKRIQGVYLLLFFLAITVFILLAYLFYNRKDITV